MGSVMLPICSARCVLYSAGFGVKRVHVGLSGLGMRLFVCVHVCISCMYDWMYVFAVFMSLCDRTPPCATPVLNWRCVDVLFLNVVYASRPLM